LQRSEIPLGTGSNKMFVLCIPSVRKGFDILHAVSELNGASHCIAANGDYFEVSAVSIIILLQAKGRA